MTRALIPGVMLLLAVAAVQPCLAVSYTGLLTVEDGGLQATERWLNDSNPYTTIYWTVEQDPSGYWSYSYRFVVERAAISHIIFEVSDGFSVNNEMDFFNPYIAYFEGGNETLITLKATTDTFSEVMGNPNLPSDFYGLKFDETAGLDLRVSFDSWRSPVWGDFYAKCGGPITNTAWNTGFTDPDTDPSAPPANGSVDYHILVPNSYETQAIPEPGTLALLGLGLAGIALWKRRRRAA